MIEVEVEVAKEQLAGLIARVGSGEIVVLLQDGVPVAELGRVRRTFGSARGKIWMSDDFDDPLPDMKPYS